MGFGKYRPLVDMALDGAQWLRQYQLATLKHERVDPSSVCLSVIVPFKNAERWIAATVHSIQSQAIENLQIIVVDDESTDRSKHIVQGLSKLDKRITILNGEGKGPGAARNLGLSHACGEFVTFADADDIVLPNAYRKMLEIITETESDFVCGGYLRHKGLSSTRPKVVDRVHRAERLKTNCSQFPEIFDEPVLWNKIYRTNFCLNAVGKIPEEINYEDQPAVLRAIANARSFDVIKQDVYSWRLSSDGNSRSGTMSKLVDIKDRKEAITIMWKFAIQSDLPVELREQMLTTWLDRNLMMYISHLPAKRPSDEYYTITKELTESVWNWAEEYPNVFQRLSLTSRLAAWALINLDYEAVLEVLANSEDLGGDYVFDSENLQALPECLPKVSKIPVDLLKARHNDLKLTTRVLDVHWFESNRIRITFFAFLAGAKQADVSELKLTVLDEKGNRLHFPIHAVNSSVTDAIVRNAWDTAARSAFNAEVDLNQGSEYHFEIQATWAGQTYTSALRSGHCKASTSSGPISEFGQFIISNFRDTDGSVFRIKWIETDNVLTIKLDSAKATVSLLDSQKVGRLDLVFGDHHAVTLRPGTDKKLSLGRMNFMSLLRGARKRYVVKSDQLVAFKIQESSAAEYLSNYELTTLDSGEPALLHQPIRVVLDDVEEADGVFIFRGRSTSNILKPQLWLVSANSVTKIDTDWNKNIFEGTVPATELRGRNYFLRWSLIPRNRFTRNAVAAGEMDKDTLISGGVKSLRIEPRANGTTLVEVLPPADVAQNTRWEKRLVPGNQALRPVIYFESFSGKTTYDNPGAICRWIAERHPNLELVIGVRDKSVSVPQNVKKVVVGSDDWFNTIRSAAVLVTNDNFPHWFEKNESQYWLQTWHGTPIKRLLLDAHPKYVGLSYRRLMLKQANEWDLLLAQNKIGAERIAGSVRYSGPISVGEYPRNLRLLESLKEADSLKRSLGISAQKKVIMWAPTWRSGKDLPSFPAKEISKLDEFVLLVRGHHMRGLSIDGQNIINVSSYPCVEELLAITDILISDYSSIFFDFALLGRTAIIYAPDLNYYRDEERGFYGSWPSESKLPTIENSVGLVDFLNTLRLDVSSTKNHESDEIKIQEEIRNIEQTVLRHYRS